MGNEDNKISIRIEALDAYSTVLENSIDAAGRMGEEFKKMGGSVSQVGQLLTDETAQMQAEYSRQASATRKIAEERAATAKKMAADIIAAEKSISGLSSKSSDRLSGSFNTLGIKSALDIEAEKARSIAAFEAIKKSGVASADEIKRAHKALQDRLNEIDKSPQKIATGLQGVSQMLIGVFALDRVVAFTRASFDASLAIDSITSKLKVMTGSNELAAKEWQYIRAEAKRLGLDLLSTADSYSTFAVATKGTALEGTRTKEVFSAMSEAVTALHLPAEKASAVMYQFQQMVSKGKIEMEDLKTASESFPGLMGMIAQSLGITTAELMKQMSAGELMAADVLPKLAEQLHLTYGKAAEEAATQGRSAINRFKSDMFELMGQVGKDIGPGLLVIGKFVATVAKGIMVTVQTAGQGLAFLFESMMTYFDPTISWGQKIDKFKELSSRLIEGAKENTEKYFGETKKLEAADKESVEERVRNEQRRRDSAKKTGEDLAKINVEYTKGVSAAEQQLSAELDKQYEERRKTLVSYYNQKKAYARDGGEEQALEEQKKARLLEIEKQHARDIEIVKAQMRSRSLDNLKNEVDMETLLVREAVGKKVMTEKQGEQRITELTVAAARMQYEAKKAVADKIVEIYGKDGEEYKKALKDQEAAQKEYLSANLTAYKKYSDEIKSLDQQIIDFRTGIQQKIADLAQRGMTEQQKYSDNQKRFDAEVSKAREALARGDFETAQKNAKQAEDLASRLADKKAQTNTQLEELEKQHQQKLSDIQSQAVGTQTDQQKKTAEAAKESKDYEEKKAQLLKEQVATSEGITNATTALNKVEQLGVNILEAKKKANVDALAKLKEIQDMKLDPKNLDVNLNETALSLVKKTIGELTATETKTIIIKTIQSDGTSSYKGYFTGGKVASGSPLRDSVAAVLARDEWVINNRATGFWGDGVMAAINDPLSAAGRRLQDAIRGQSMAGGGQSMGTLNLQLGDSVYPVQGKIDVLQELTTQLRRRRLAGFQK